MFSGVCILALLALSAYAQDAQSPNSRIDTAIQKCEQDIKLTGPIRNLTESLINDPKTKCYVACIWREMEVVNEDNTFNLTRWIQSTSTVPRDPDVDQSINECSRESDPDQCETAYKFHMCLNRKGII